MRDYSISEPVVGRLRNYFSGLLKTSKKPQQQTEENTGIWDVASKMLQGYRLLDAGKPKDAFACYEEAAASGSPVGQYKLAELYYNFWETLGFDRDEAYKNAFDLYGRAAAQNHEQALFCLGDMYDRGHGVEQNQEIAIKCWKCAENNARLPELGV